MRSQIFSFALAGVLFLAVSLCWAAGLPEKFSGITEGHPGSTVVKSSELPMVARVEMNAKASASDVFSFYKTELTAKGWTVGVENAQMLVLSKDGRQFVVGVQTESGGELNYTLMLR